MTSYPRNARLILIPLVLLGLGACNSPSAENISPCDDSMTTKCLTSYDEWSWTNGVASGVASLVQY
ncbi:hypothetical protein [Paracoccus methylarcula]|nr:hypothetical protein [Paracoccus methylarcula]